FFFRHPPGVKRFLGERAVAGHRLEGRIDDVLRQRRVAADVALSRDGQPSRAHFAEDVTQVEVGFGDALELRGAHLAQVALLALRHRDPLPARPSRSLATLPLLYSHRTSPSRPEEDLCNRPSYTATRRPSSP